MKTYVLYHGNCPDGFAAATAAWLKLGDEAEYIPVSYGEPMPPLETLGKVFILDFSYPRAELLALAQRMERVVVLDHHATAQADLAGLDLPGEESEIVFDMERSGAALAWEFFHGDELPELVLYVEDRDLWRFRLPRSREVSCAVRSHPMEFDLWAGWMEGGGAAMKELAGEGAACLRLMNQQVDAMARNHRWVLLNSDRWVQFFSGLAPGLPAGKLGSSAVWWCVPVANASVFFSEVGERLLQRHPEAPFAAYYFDRADGRQQWGLRSRPDFDCSVVARAFGGGGHRQASGFVI